jgi:hypothetical protein
VGYQYRTGVRQTEDAPAFGDGPSPVICRTDGEVQWSCYQVGRGTPMNRGRGVIGGFEYGHGICRVHAEFTDELVVTHSKTAE